MTRDRVAAVDAFVVDLPRDRPYLGEPLPGEVAWGGYIVRSGNRTIYPTGDRSVLIRVTTADGCVGWGETYGLVAPRAVGALVDDLIRPFVIGRDPFDAGAVWEDLYDLMRVRGYTGGFWLDALAGLDIALWDAAGKLAGLPLAKLLGGVRRDRIPAYVSGLPAEGIEAKVELARDWVERGYRGIKLHGVTSDALVDEVAALRDALGPDVALMVDLHWRYDATEAASLIRRLEPFRIAFAEAPCKPEDLAGLAEVARRTRVPIAAGEEWRTVFDARARLEARAVSIVQPEMGHTGVTQFTRIARMAEAFHVRTAPHATIGVGVFMAASLQASAALLDLPFHEYQPSVFDRNLRFVTGDMGCADGFYAVPTGPGLGVEPTAELIGHVAEC